MLRASVAEKDPLIVERASGLIFHGFVDFLDYCAYFCNANYGAYQL